MSRGRTIHQTLWPDSAPEFSNIANLWPEDMVNEMLDLVWDGFDRLHQEKLCRIDFTEDYEQVERSLTELHSIEIQTLWAQRTGGFAAYIQVHESWDWESRSSAGAIPPSVDIGFVLREPNNRIRFPVEAKLLETPARTAPYTKDLTDKYLAGKGAVFTTKGALVGYLRSGKPSEVFPEIEQALEITLSISGHFDPRPHRLSFHERSKEVLKPGVPTNFECHWMIMGLS
tara:strand:+ start:6841 stop:7527 length:687 start_codon:yes stop_codon:yes gene_type:complete